MFSRGFRALWFQEFNQMRFDGKPNDSFRLAFAPSAVTARDEVTEGQLLFLGMRFHRHLAQGMNRFHILKDGLSGVATAWN